MFVKKPAPKIDFATGIFIGLVLGAIIGAASNYYITRYLDPAAFAHERKIQCDD